MFQLALAFAEKIEKGKELMEREKILNKEVIKHFPKVELHRHLEGTYQLQTLYELAKKNGISSFQSFEEFKKENQFPKNSKPDFLTFLSKFRNDWYRSIEDISFITYHAVKTFSFDNLFYIELRFNPEHYAAFNNFDRVLVTKTVIEAAQKAAKEDSIRIKFLITLNRGKQSVDELIALYHKIKNVSPDICGFDLAGDETNYPPESFKELFSQIKNDGQKVTIHAGEVSPPQQIWDSIHFLKADRIGHGTTSIYDETLQKHLQENNIVLEQCLTSNHQTGSWPDTATHPFGRLFKTGTPVTLNSDDPHIQDSDLSDDYLLAIRHFGLTIDDLVKVNLTAINGAFLSQEQKEELKQDYLKAVDNFRKKIEA